MISEPHVDDPPLFLDGTLDKGKNKVVVVFYLVNLPDYIVSETEPIEYLIKTWKTCACGEKMFS